MIYSMNNHTKVLSVKQISELKKRYHRYLSPKTIPYVEYQIHLSDCTITVYESHKVVFQGESAEVYASAYDSTFVAHSGSDEVGTGDVFGPVVVVACSIDALHYERIKDYHIEDSKLLTDEYIQSIGSELMAKIPHSLLILDNPKYNQVHKTNNLNQIKAKLHNQAYLHLKEKVNLPELNVIDQFTPETSYFKYLEGEKEIFKDLHFETKAESKYLAVAVASIIARYAFLQQMDALSAQYHLNIPKGAGSLVDQTIHVFIEKYGVEALTKVAKVHFKNITNVLK